eukprot:gene7948-12415_t
MKQHLTTLILTFILFIHHVSSKLTLKGSGSSAVLHAMLISEPAFTSLNPTLAFSYDSVGSGAGLDNLRNKKDDYDFAISEYDLQDIDYTNEPSFQMIPFQIGSISIMANIPELRSKNQRLTLNQKTLVQIFDNTITQWNDARIAATNPSVSLPAQPIRRIVRLSSSGTTSTFTESLSKFDASWTDVSSNPTWPNEATDPNFKRVESSKISIETKNADYSISYLQDEPGGCSVTDYLVKIQNADGNYVIANTTTTGAAVDSIGLNFNEKFIGDFVNPSGSLAYPINAVSYFVYRSKTNATDCSRQIALHHFSKSFLFGVAGQSIVVSTLRYPSTASSIVKTKIIETINKMECSGKLITDFYVVPDYSPMIIGGSIALVGILFAMLFLVVIVIASIAAIFVLRSMRHKKYYENLIF